jgi:hypothetical protein
MSCGYLATGATCYHKPEMEGFITVGEEAKG